MKKFLFTLIAVLAAATGTKAQNSVFEYGDTTLVIGEDTIVIPKAKDGTVPLAELMDDFTGTFKIMQGETDFIKLHKEVGKFQTRQNKTKKIAKLAGKAAGVAADVLPFGGVLKRAKTGNGILKVTKTGDTLRKGKSLANKAADAFASMDGKDVIYNGLHSRTAVPMAGQDVRILVNTGDATTDPEDYIRIIRFKTEDKNRYFTYKQMAYLDIKTLSKKTDETEEDIDYVPFDVEPYDQIRLVIIIRAEDAREGEYGIQRLFQRWAGMDTTLLPVATFSIQ